MLLINIILYIYIYINFKFRNFKITETDSINTTQ